MTAADRAALQRLAGGRKGVAPATANDLQVLLLQIVFALLMVFMIAYFLFVDRQKKDRVEEVMDLNRQKLTLALEKTAEDHRIRYGLNALMTQGTDGKRTFEPDAFVRGGKLQMAPAARKAFSAGATAAYADYSNTTNLVGEWRSATLASAGLAEADIDEQMRAWLTGAIRQNVENVRLDARGVQRALAARLQRQWIEHPSELNAVRDVGEIADRLKSLSLKRITEETGAEVLP